MMNAIVRDDIDRHEAADVLGKNSEMGRGGTIGGISGNAILLPSRTVYRRKTQRRR
jgi:hypothetical protein